MIGIIDCGGANLNSIKYSLERIGKKSFVSNIKSELSNADSLILPGVGSAGIIMKSLRKNKLIDFISNTNKPTLGICIGMQILFEYSDEDKTECLGIFKGKIKKFKNNEMPVPQMGWNIVTHSNTGLFQGIQQDCYMYLVHSYFVPIEPETSAKSNYAGEYSVAINKNNFYGVQFHPEKSSKAGSQLLENFLKI